MHAYEYGNTVGEAGGETIQSGVNTPIRNPENIPTVGLLLLLAGAVLGVGEVLQSVQTSPWNQLPTGLAFLT